MNYQELCLLTDSRRVHRRYKGIVIMEERIVRKGFSPVQWTCFLLALWSLQSLLILATPSPAQWEQCHWMTSQWGLTTDNTEYDGRAFKGGGRLHGYGEGGKPHETSFASYPGHSFNEGLGTRWRVVVIWWYGSKRRAHKMGAGVPPMYIPHISVMHHRCTGWRCQRAWSSVEPEQECSFSVLLLSLSPPLSLPVLKVKVQGS